MAHPDRSLQVARLRESLQHPSRVAFDMDGQPSRDPERIWSTARRAWEMHDTDADWHVLLQDDAVVAANLMEELPHALAHVPRDAVVSLYLGTGRPLAGAWGQVVKEAREVNASWITAPRPMWGVGLVMPTHLIAGMVRYCNTQRGIPDDMRLGRWVQRSKLETWYTWPCLVDHPDGASLVGHGAGRTAHCFRSDARGCVWDGPVVKWK